MCAHVKCVFMCIQQLGQCNHMVIVYCFLLICKEGKKSESMMNPRYWVGATGRRELFMYRKGDN